MRRFPGRTILSNTCGIAMLMAFTSCGHGNGMPSMGLHHAGSNDEYPPHDRPLGVAPVGMVWIPSGEFLMGTNDLSAYPEERPAHRVYVHGYWMDTTEVTNARFAEFVNATGYRTDAERAPLLEEIMANTPPGTPAPDPSQLVPGSLVFTPPKHPVDLHDWRQWWQWVPGADWQHPEGAGSSIADRLEHPVVHVSWRDVQAYCRWAGKRLPTEAEWERAARGGVSGTEFSWGNDPPTNEHITCNSWQGAFPNANTAADGYARTAPVASFNPNGFGLYDIVGNVWEWCSDWMDVTYYGRCEPDRVLQDPQGPTDSFDPQHPYEKRRAQRGGSFLCHASYCARYRTSARQGSTEDSGMSHAGFRCVKDGE